MKIVCPCVGHDLRWGPLWPRLCDMFFFQYDLRLSKVKPLEEVVSWVFSWGLPCQSLTEWPWRSKKWSFEDFVTNLLHKRSVWDFESCTKLIKPCKIHQLEMYSSLKKREFDGRGCYHMVLYGGKNSSFSASIRVVAVGTSAGHGTGLAGLVAGSRNEPKTRVPCKHQKGTEGGDGRKPNQHKLHLGKCTKKSAVIWKCQSWCFTRVKLILWLWFHVGSFQGVLPPSFLQNDIRFNKVSKETIKMVVWM